MYNAIREYKKSPLGASYQKLFVRLRRKLPEDSSFEQVSDKIESLHVLDVERPNLLDPRSFLKALLEKKPSQVIYQVRRKLGKLKKITFSQSKIAELLLERSKTERLRLGRVRNVDIQLDRLFKDKVYVSKTLTIYESIRSLLLVTFLSMQLRSVMDESILNALDFCSLVRMSMIKGGESFKVPTYTEVEAVLASTYFFYLKDFEGLSEEVALGRVKKDLQIDIKYRELRSYYNSLAMLYSKEIHRDSTPLAQVLKKLTTLIQDLQERLKESVSNVQDSEEFLRMYKDVNKSFLALSRGLGGV